MRNARATLTFVAMFMTSIAIGCRESGPTKVPSVAEHDSSGPDAQDPDVGANALRPHGGLEQRRKITKDIEEGMKASELEHRQRYPHLREPLDDPELKAGEIDVQAVTPSESDSENRAPGNPDGR